MPRLPDEDSHDDCGDNASSPSSNPLEPSFARNGCRLRKHNLQRSRCFMSPYCFEKRLHFRLSKHSLQRSPCCSRFKRSPYFCAKRLHTLTFSLRHHHMRNRAVNEYLERYRYNGYASPDCGTFTQSTCPDSTRYNYLFSFE